MANGRLVDALCSPVGGIAGHGPVHRTRDGPHLEWGPSLRTMASGSKAITPRGSVRAGRLSRYGAGPTMSKGYVNVCAGPREAAPGTAGYAGTSGTGAADCAAERAELGRRRATEKADGRDADDCDKCDEKGVLHEAGAPLAWRARGSLLRGCPTNTHVRSVNNPNDARYGTAPPTA